MARARTLTLNAKVNVTGADKLKGLGSKLQSAGKTLTTGLTLPIVALGGAFVAAAVEAEKSQAKLESTFKSMGAAAWTTVDALNATGAELQQMTTFGDEEIRDLQGVLLTFGNVTGEAFDGATVAALDMSAALGQDLQSSAIQLGKALNDPIKGISALTRVGVSFTEQQKEQIRVLTESGDVLGAQTVILELLEDQFDGTAEALAGTAGGKMQQAFNALGDAAESFGEVILPVLADVATSVKEFAEFLQTLDPTVRKNIILFGGLAAALGPVLLIVGSLVKAFASLIGVAKAVGPAISLLRVAFGPLGLIGILGAAALAIDNFVDNALSPLSDGMRDLASAAGEDVIKVEKVIGGLADSLDVEFSTAERRVREYMERTGRDFDTAVKAVERGLTAMTDAEWDRVEEAGNTWAAQQNVISDAIYGSGGIVPTVAAGVDDAADEAGKLPGEMADAMLAEQQKLSDATTQLVNFMEQALSPAQEKYRLQGFLSSRQLAEGLADGNSLVRQKAAELRDAAISRLNEIDGSGAGYRFVQSFADSIARNAWRAVNVTSAMAAQVMGIMPRSEPKDPNSPFRGITKGWGFMDTFAQGLASTSGVVNRTLANALAAPALSPVVAGSGGSAGPGDATVINNFYMTFAGEPPKTRNEAEIIANLQRVTSVASTWG
jgi:hypothetical protein